MKSSPTLRFLALASALVMAACDSSPTPSEMEAASPGVIQGEVGAAVATPPVVRVVDSGGRGVAGVEVVFSVVAGGGAITGERPRTDGQGEARLGSWTLGEEVGVNRVSAQVDGLSGVVFEAVAAAGPPTRLRMETEPSATVENHRPFSRVPAVRLVDRFGNPAGGAGVEIRATLFGGGTPPVGAAPDEVEERAALTDAQGVARFTALRVAGSMGERYLTFTSQGVSPVESARFNLLPGDADRLRLVTSPQGPVEVGMPWPRTPVVQLQDRFLNDVPMAGVEVEARLPAGAGELDNGVVLTDAAGRAEFPDLRLRSGSSGNPALSFHTSGAEAIHSAPIQVLGRWPVRVHLYPEDSPKESVQVDGTTLVVTDPIGSVTVRDRSQVAVEVGNAPLSDGRTLVRWHWVVFDAGHPDFPGLASVNSTPSLLLNDPAVVHQGVVENGNSIGLIPANQVVGPIFLALFYDLPGPASMEAVMGQGQSAPAGEELPLAPTVQVLTAGGNPVAGVEVRFEVVSGGGSVRNAVTTTNALGGAQSGWTLGPLVGNQSVRAFLPGHPQVAPVLFTAQATGAVPPPPLDIPLPPAPGPHAAGWDGPNTLPLRIIESNSRTGSPVVLSVIVDGEARSFYRSAVSHSMTVNVPRGKDLRIIAHFQPNPVVGVGGWGFATLKYKALHVAWPFDPSDIHPDEDSSYWDAYTHNAIPGQAPATWFGHLRTYCGAIVGPPGPLPYFWDHTLDASITANPDTKFLVAWIIDHQVPRPAC